MSVGTSSYQRKIVDVADGDVSSGSTDAVNGGQLYDVEQNVAALDTNGVTDYFISTSDGSGTPASATGTGALAIGSGAQSSGTNAIGIGAGAYSAANSVVVGGGASDNDATGVSIFGTNASSTITSLNSVVIGFDASVDGVGAIAIGNGASATADNSVALGADRSPTRPTAFRSAHRRAGAPSKTLRTGRLPPATSRL